MGFFFTNKFKVEIGANDLQYNSPQSKAVRLRSESVNVKVWRDLSVALSNITKKSFILFLVLGLIATL